jgi:hypothetical protein
MKVTGFNPIERARPDPTPTHSRSPTHSARPPRRSIAGDLPSATCWHPAMVLCPGQADGSGPPVAWHLPECSTLLVISEVDADAWSTSTGRPRALARLLLQPGGQLPPHRWSSIAWRCRLLYSPTPPHHRSTTTAPRLCPQQEISTATLRPWRMAPAHASPSDVAHPQLTAHSLPDYHTLESMSDWCG